VANEPDDVAQRGAGLDDATVRAVGKVSEALEFVERARGHLYSFHQLIGHADLLLGDACDDLTAAGHPVVATRLQTELVGRNVLHGRWTFQVVEEFDDGYWSVFRDYERFSKIVSLVDQNGKPFNQNGGSWGGGRGNTMEFGLYFAGPSQASQPKELRVTLPSQMKEIRVPFEFTDLPLPH